MATVAKKKDADTDKRYPRVSVRNFGPIAEGSVDLRPLTVFVGPSNTGKSYLAILIYALHRFFGPGQYRGMPYLRVPRRRHRAVYRTIEELGRDRVEQMASWAESLESQLPAENAVIELPRFLVDSVRERLSGIKEHEGAVDEIKYSFGTESLGKLALYKSRGGMSVSVTRSSGAESGSEISEFSLISEKGRARIETDILDKERLVVSGNWRPPPSPMWMEFLDEKLAIRRAGVNFVSMIGDLVLDYEFGPFVRPSYYLPADRAGIMNAHVVALSSLVQTAPTDALGGQRNSPGFSGVLRDFLSDLVSLGRFPSQLEKDDAGSDIEANMLGGVIHIEESITGYPEFMYTPIGWRSPMPLMNTSSMVSELAPVVLYLRHIVHPGDLLIIEEPESHLHPAMQVEFVRQLAAVVKAGVRILIATHSEWVLEELANLVRLHGLSESDRANIDHPGPALSPDDVGIWLFEPRKRTKGSVITEIPFEAEEGGYISDYEQVAIDTHNTWARISNRIEALRQE